MKYKIPNDILDEIPESFYPAFTGEICAIFDPGAFTKQDGTMELR